MACREADGDIEIDEGERVTQPAQAVDDGALASLSAQLDRIAEALDGAAALEAALPPLATDLMKCQAIVSRIDELLQAMAR